MKHILGIDPGLAETGFGIIGVQANTFTPVYHACVKTPAAMPTGERLKRIYDETIQILQTYKIGEAGIESLYFAKNITSALPVAQARGVVLLALQQHGIAAAEYTPAAIKMALVGYGKADKQQIQQMVCVILGMTQKPATSHAADALAAAICHANTTACTQKIQG